MKILIAGAGIAGLTAASLLERQGHEIVVVEKAPHFRHLGFGIALWDKGQRILQKLGMQEEIAENAYELPSYTVQNERRAVLKTVDFQKYFSGYLPTLMIEREDLHKALAAAAKRSEIRFSTEINHIRETEDSVTVSFQNGTTEEFDLLIGADGVGSPVRQKVFPESRLTPYNWEMALFWAESTFPFPAGVEQMLGPGKQFTLFPFGKDKCLVTISRYWEAEEPLGKMDTAEYWQRYFSDWGGNVPEVLTHFPSSEKVFARRISKVEAPAFAHGRIVLIGDAAHALSPLMGMGASLAMEDAFVLSEDLKNTDSTALVKTLGKYAKKRKKYAHKVQAQEKQMWRWACVRSQYGAKLRNFLLPMIPPEFFTSGMKRILQ